MQKKQPKKPVSVHWKVRLTRANHKQFVARTLNIASRYLHLESEQNLKTGETIKVEIFALHEGVKKLIVAVGLVKSSVLLSTGTSYSITLSLDKMSEGDHQFVEAYIKARESLAIHR